MNLALIVELLVLRVGVVVDLALSNLAGNWSGLQNANVICQCQVVRWNPLFLKYLLASPADLPSPLCGSDGRSGFGVHLGD